MNEARFEKWRLLAFAAGAGTTSALWCWTMREIDYYGFDGFAGLCILACIFLAAATCGLPFKKALTFMLCVALILFCVIFVSPGMGTALSGGSMRGRRCRPPRDPADGSDVDR